MIKLQMPPTHPRPDSYVRATRGEERPPVRRDRREDLAEYFPANLAGMRWRMYDNH